MFEISDKRKNASGDIRLKNEISHCIENDLCITVFFFNEDSDIKHFNTN